MCPYEILYILLFYTPISFTFIRVKGFNDMPPFYFNCQLYFINNKNNSCIKFCFNLFLFLSFVTNLIDSVFISVSEDPSALEKQGLLPHPHWPVWRPVPSSMMGSSSSYVPTDRSLYTLYGGLFGLGNAANLVFPSVAFHPFVSANNLRLRESLPNSSSYSPSESSSSSGLHYPASLYRYHPYLSPEKMAQKSTESSSVVDGCRP